MVDNDYDLYNWWVHPWGMDTDIKRAISTGFEENKENEMTTGICTIYRDQYKDDVQLRLDIMELAKDKVIEFETSREFVVYVNDLFKFVKSNLIVAKEEE